MLLLNVQTYNQLFIPYTFRSENYFKINTF